MSSTPESTPNDASTPDTAPPSKSARRPKRRSPQHSAAGLWVFFVVFLAGAALMAFEIVGSRLLAPFFGSSTFVWGSLIGVFLAALAIGYAIGGRVADRYPTGGALSAVLTAASLLVMVTVFIAHPLQEWIVEIDFGARTNPLVASILLFTPASILIGMVSPWAVRLRADELVHVGRTAGSLYGLSTAGSIVGTLLASFWLIQWLGAESTVLVVAVTLALCAVIASVGSGARVMSTALASGSCLGLTLLALMSVGGAATVGSSDSPTSTFSPAFRAGGYTPQFAPRPGGKQLERIDSAYHRIRVVDYATGQISPDQPARVLHFDNSLQAAAPLKDGQPVTTGTPLFSYLRAWDQLPALAPDAERVLLVGLGSGAMAMRLHELNPELEIDVIEIDPKVVDVARKWFGYRDSENGNPKIRTHVSDGRTWLRKRSDEKFDAIILDTYFSDSIPFHLTTKEFLTLVRDRLTPNGIAGANLIGAVEGGRSELMRSFDKTWREVFPDVIIYPIPGTDGEIDLRRFSNVELIAAKERGVLPPRGSEQTLIEDWEQQSKVKVLDPMLRSILAARYVGDLDHDDVPVLTDDLAPVDSLLQVDGTG